MAWIAWSMSHGLNGLAYEAWSGWFRVWAMVWVVWGMSYCLNVLGYELLSRWFGVWAIVWRVWGECAAGIDWSSHGLRQFCYDKARGFRQFYYDQSHGLRGLIYTFRQFYYNIRVWGIRIGWQRIPCSDGSYSIDHDDYEDSPQPKTSELPYPHGSSETFSQLTQ